MSATRQLRYRQRLKERGVKTGNMTLTGDFLRSVDNGMELLGYDSRKAALAGLVGVALAQSNGLLNEVERKKWKPEAEEYRATTRRLLAALPVCDVTQLVAANTGKGDVESDFLLDLEAASIAGGAVSEAAGFLSAVNKSGYTFESFIQRIERQRELMSENEENEE